MEKEKMKREQMRRKEDDTLNAFYNMVAQREAAVKFEREMGMPLDEVMSDMTDDQMEVKNVPMEVKNVPNEINDDDFVYDEDNLVFDYGEDDE